MLQNNSEHNKRIAKNTIMLYIRMFLIMGVTLYTSRVVLNILGVEDYGIYNVVGGLVIFFSFIQGAMNTSVQRYLNIALGKEDTSLIKKIFSTSLIVYTVIALIVFVLGETVGVWYLNNYINLPVNRYVAALVVFQTSLISAIFLIFQTPYNAMIIAYEKMDFFAYVSIFEVILKLLIVFLLKYVSFFDSLKLYAILNLVITILIFLIYKIYLYIKYETSHFNYKFFDKKSYKDILTFSSWTLFGSFSVIGVNQGIALIFNFFYGVVINTSLGVANQVSTAINKFIVNFQIAFNPQIVKSYARSDLDYLKKLLLSTSKFSYLLMFVISLSVLIETKFIMFLWLRQLPEFLVPFTQIMILSLLIESLSGPLWSVIYASGNIKKYQILISSSLLFNVLLVFVCVKIGFNPAIAISSKILICLVTLIIRLILINKIIKSFSFYFLKDVIKPLFIVSLLSCFVPYIIYCTFEEGYFRLLLVLISSIIGSLTISFFFGLSKNESIMVKQKIESLIKKIKPS